MDRPKLSWGPYMATTQACEAADYDDYDDDDNSNNDNDNDDDNYGKSNM